MGKGQRRWFREHDHLVVPEHVLMRRMGGSVVLLNLVDDEIYELNGLAAHAYLALRTPSTLAELVDGVRSEVAIDRTRLAVNLQSLVTELLDIRLLEIADSPAGRS